MIKLSYIGIAGDTEGTKDCLVNPNTTRLAMAVERRGYTEAIFHVADQSYQVHVSESPEQIQSLFVEFHEKETAEGCSTQTSFLAEAHKPRTPI